jgi:hypothetical protein
VLFGQVRVSLHRRLARLPRFLFQLMQRIERLRHRWGLLRPRVAHDAAPEVGKLVPIGLALRVNGDLSAKHGAERHNRRDGDEVERALHPLGNVDAPRRDALRDKRLVERINRQ